MKKKVYNWLGYGVFAIFVLILAVLIALIIYESQKTVPNFSKIGNLLIFGISLLVIMIMMMPRIYRKTLCNCLPEIRTYARLINKNGMMRTEYGSEAQVYQYLSLFLTFELPDGTRKNFLVPPNIFNTVLINDVGVLVYKEQGKYQFSSASKGAGRLLSLSSADSFYKVLHMRKSASIVSLF